MKQINLSMDFEDPLLLRELAEQKEKEWKDLSEKRLQALEDSARQKDELVKQHQDQLLKLKEDFKYNLRLLQERDEELERYDLTFADLRAQLNVRNAEVSELRIQLDDMKKAVGREQFACDDLHALYQRRLREKQAEMDAFKSTKNGEVMQERAEFESLRRKLQRQLTELEADSDRQRHELTTEFEEALKKREHEFRVQIDEMSAKVLEYDLKGQLLAKELGLVRGEQQRHSKEVEAAGQCQRDLEKQLKQTQWQLADTTAIKDARVRDLEEQLKRQDKAASAEQEDFNRKYAELDRTIRDHEASAQRIRSAFEEKEQILLDQVQQLQCKLEDANIHIRQLQWTNSDLKKDCEMQVEKLQSEVLALQTKWDVHIKDTSRDTVARDVELQSTHEEISRLRSELAQRKDDLLRYKKELLHAVEREKALEQAKAQLDVDWRQRCEQLERRQYDKSEDLIASLTRARDEALATVKERSRELEQTSLLLHAVTRDRDWALATLKKHNIPFEKSLEMSHEEHSEQEMQNLHEQNRGLRAALAAMRQRMESLGQALPSAVAVSMEQSPEYTQSLEKELKELKKQNLELVEKVAQAEKFGRLVTSPPEDSQHVLSEVKDTGVRNHILSLNSMIGVLRGEKVELAAVVKKQQARLQHLEMALEETAKQPQELQVTVEQLRYENGAQQRRHAAEVAALRQRVAQLEGQLTEAQREADMFHQASVENNAELTALRNQVSALKLDLAEKRPAINFGAEELVIQQLQEELASLRNRASQLNIGHKGNGDDLRLPGEKGVGVSVSELRSRLLRAVKHIAQLVRDKQQLIELSTRLQAELKQTGVHMPGQTDKAGKTKQFQMCAEPKEKDASGRLSQLEILQYQLTKQELQYAQRFVPPPEPDGHSRPACSVQKQAAADRGQDTELGNADASHINQRLAATGNALGTSPTLASVELSLSSVGGQSMQDVWHLLDSPASPELPSDRGVDTRTALAAKQGLRLSGSDEDVAVSGHHLAVHRKENTPGSKVKAGVSKMRRVKTPQRPRVRNYNVKDDGGTR